MFTCRKSSSGYQKCKGRRKPWTPSFKQNNKCSKATHQHCSSVGVGISTAQILLPTSPYNKTWEIKLTVALSHKSTRPITRLAKITKCTTVFVCILTSPNAADTEQSVYPVRQDSHKFLELLPLPCSHCLLHPLLASSLEVGHQLLRADIMSVLVLHSAQYN